MKCRKHTKGALTASILSVILCCVLLIGSTFAWFTDSATSKNNVIQSGELKVELEYRDGNTWKPVTEDTKLFREQALWEPGHTEVVYLRVKNAGDLALSYKLGIAADNETTFTNALGETGCRLSDYLVFGHVESSTEIPAYAAREDAWKAAGETQGLSEYTGEGELYPQGTAGKASEQYVALVVYMPVTVGNEANYRGDTAPSIDLGVKLDAAQHTYEGDSFGTDYDADAQYPWDGVTMTEVVPDAEGNYPVSTAAELAWMAHEINEGYINETTIVLENDIDLNGKAWTPIGGQGYFTGTFDGKGHVVKNLAASENALSSDPTKGVALFGYVEDAVIKNVKFENVQMHGRYAVAAVVGDGAGFLTFENIEILSGSIQADQNDSGRTAQVAGAILGQGWGNRASGDQIIFKNCINRADITVNKQHAGGLWGSVTMASYVDVSVENCHNYGTVVSLSQDNGGYAGGFGGYLDAKSLSITESSNHGRVTADQYQGNFVGYSVLTGGSVDK